MWGECLDLQGERLGGGRQLRQLLGEGEPDARRVGARVTQRDGGAPGAARDEARRYRQPPQRAPAPLAPREHASDQELQRPLQLLARGGLGQVEPLDDGLEWPPWIERGVAAAAEVEREQAGMPKRSATAREGAPQLAERANAEPLEHLGQRLELGPGAEGETGSGARKSRTAAATTT